MLLKDTRRFDQAINEILKARNLDPLSLVINRNVGVIFISARQYDNAIEALNKVIEIDPELSEWGNLASSDRGHPGLNT